MRVLYVLGAQPDDTPSPMEELAAIEPALDVQTAAGAAAALVEIRAHGEYRAIFLSPQLPQNEALALVATLRRDRTPVAIVAIITDDQRQFFAPAITAGADDVLVMRETGLMTAEETLRRVRHSRHLERPEGHPPLHVLYVGQDELAWDLLTDMPFVSAERTMAEVDGSCPLTMEGGNTRADAIIVDEQPGEGHALQVVKWLKAHAADIPLVVLTSPTGHDVGGAALELGADDVVTKSGMYRRRLVATLHRHYLRLAATSSGSTRSEPGGPVEPVEPAEPGEPAEPDESAEIARIRAALDAAARIEELTAEVQELGTELSAQRQSYDELRDAQEFERALREREQKELARLRQTLAEEQERRIALEVTLRQTEDRIAIDTEELHARHAEDRRNLEEQLAAAAARLQQVATQTQELQARLKSDDELRDAQEFERALRDREQKELAQLRQTLTEEQERRIALEVTLRQTEDRVATDNAHAEARHAEDRRNLEEQLAATAARLQQVATQTRELQARRKSDDELREEQGFERAMRERDQEELAQLRQKLVEERERRIVLEGTLRQTEDRVAADTADLEARHAAVRRNLEEQLAAAADRLHQVANQTQELQTRLQNEVSDQGAERDRLVQNHLFGWATVTLEGTLVRCNTAFARMFGFDSPADALAGTDAVFTGLADHAHVVQQLQAGADVDRVESVLHRADGRPFRVLTSAAFRPSGDDAPPTIERVLVDIDDRAQIEDQLRLARRLESAGRLAAEMSPEIEPMLSAIDDPEAAAAERRRVAMLVRQLLAFSRHQAKPAGWLSLYDAVRRAEPQLRQIADDLATVEFRLQDVGGVAGSEDDIEHLLAALMFAATGSLPYGGTITLETRSVRTGFDQWTELAVTAAGYGVHSASISSSLARLVTKCGGTVRVTDDPARATTLLVHLPC